MWDILTTDPSWSLIAGKMRCSKLEDIVAVASNNEQGQIGVGLCAADVLSISSHRVF